MFLKTFILVYRILKTNDIYCPIIVSKDGYILDGQTRVNISKALGHKMIDGVIVGNVESIEIDKLKNMVLTSTCGDFSGDTLSDSNHE